MHTSKNAQIDKKTSLRLGCMPLECVLMSVAIIVVRAFQPGAQPIESWSVISWILMLLPIALPIFMWIAVFVCWVLCNAFSKSN